MIHMVIGKSRHSIIAMVVVGLVADFDAFHALLRRRLFKVLGEELALLVEIVAGSLFVINSCPIRICIQDPVWRERGGTYNINQRIQRTRPFLDKFRGIVLLPFGLLILPEVPAECLLAPLAVNRVGDGCECRDGLVFARVAEELTHLLHPLCPRTE